MASATPTGGALREHVPSFDSPGEGRGAFFAVRVDAPASWMGAELCLAAQDPEACSAAMRRATMCNIPASAATGEGALSRACRPSRGGARGSGNCESRDTPTRNALRTPAPTAQGWPASSAGRPKPCSRLFARSSRTPCASASARSASTCPSARLASPRRARRPSAAVIARTRNPRSSAWPRPSRTRGRGRSSGRRCRKPSTACAPTTRSSAPRRAAAPHPRSQTAPCDASCPAAVAPGWACGRRAPAAGSAAPAPPPSPRSSHPTRPRPQRPSRRQGRTKPR